MALDVTAKNFDVFHFVLLISVAPCNLIRKVSHKSQVNASLFGVRCVTIW